MANGMIIPPWLEAGDPVSAYARGTALGAQIGEQVQRNTLAQQTIQARSIENERERMMQQAKMEMDYAYKQAALDMQGRVLEERAQKDAQAFALNEQYKQAQMARMQAMTEHQNAPQWTPEYPEELGGGQFLTQRNLATGAIRRQPVGLSPTAKAVEDRTIRTQNVSMMRQDIRDLAKEALSLEAEVPPEGSPIKSTALRQKADRLNQVRKELGEKRGALRDYITRGPTSAQEMPETGTDLDEEEPVAEPTATPQPQPTPTPKGKTLTREQTIQFLKQAGGDKDKARALARQAGFDI